MYRLSVQAALRVPLGIHLKVQELAPQEFKKKYPEPSQIWIVFVSKDSNPNISYNETICPVLTRSYRFGGHGTSGFESENLQRRFELCKLHLAKAPD